MPIPKSVKKVTKVRLKNGQEMKEMKKCERSGSVECQVGNKCGICQLK